MFIIRIWNYLRGYAIIIVEGLKIERFINLAIINGLYIWDIKKQSYTTIKAKVGLNNFAKLREIVRKTNSSVTIIEKRGLPFVLKSLKRRKLLSLGLVLLLAFIFYISTRIWMIEIVGVKDIEEEVILQNLALEGLKEGIYKGSIDKREIENGMLIRLSDLSWIGIQIKGTKALVEVVEKKNAPLVISKDDYCDIVASKNGVISKPLILNGDALVKDGDTVKKGQVLVSGTILREGLPPRYVHSIAKMTARIWYEEVEEMPLKQIELVPTGRDTTRYRLKIINSTLSQKENIFFEEYNKYVEEKNILSFGDYVFPVKLIKTRYEELKAVEKVITVEEAKKRCEERLNGKIKMQLPEGAVILDKKIDYFEDENSVKAKITVEVLEDIGAKQKIDTSGNSNE